MTTPTDAKPEPDLLPCPFCGKAARVFHWKGHYGCSDVACGAYAANVPFDQWNRRVPITPAPESSEVARLRAELENAKAALGEHPDTEVDLAQRISELRDLTAELDALKEQLDPLAYDTEVRRLILRAEKAEAELDALRQRVVELEGALESCVYIVDRATLLNLSRGVELGATSWFVKATERFDHARKLLTPASAGTKEEKITCPKCKSTDVVCISSGDRPEKDGMFECYQCGTEFLPSENQASPTVTPLPFDLLKALAGWPVVTKQGCVVSELKQERVLLGGTINGVYFNWYTTGRCTNGEPLCALFLAQCPPDLCIDCWGIGKRTPVGRTPPRCEDCNSIHNE